MRRKIEIKFDKEEWRLKKCGGTVDKLYPMDCEEQEREKYSKILNKGWRTGIEHGW